MQRKVTPREVNSARAIGLIKGVVNQSRVRGWLLDNITHQESQSTIVASVIGTFFFLDKGRSGRPPVVAIAKIAFCKLKGMRGQSVHCRNYQENAQPRSLGIPELYTELYTGVLRIFSRFAETGAGIERKMAKTKSEAIFMEDCAPSHRSKRNQNCCANQVSGVWDKENVPRTLQSLKEITHLSHFF